MCNITKLTILSICIFSFQTIFGQVKIDTSWQIGNNQFRLQLEKTEDTGLKNTKVTLFKNAKFVLLDSIYSSTLRIEFSDMNTDRVKDLLVFQSSGARNNNTYNLYLLRRRDNAYVKVKKFEDWPNLKTTKIKSILVSMALTGTVYYHFFRLTDTGKLIDLGIEEQDEGLDGKGYFRGLAKVKKLLQKK